MIPDQGLAAPIKLVVSKIDAGMATLITPDLQVIEFPSMLLPSAMSPGSVVHVTVTRHVESEAQLKDQFIGLQESILKEFGSFLPEPPVISEDPGTPKTFAWRPLQLHSSQLLAMDWYIDGTKVFNYSVSTAAENTITFSGLESGKAHTVQLVIRTSSGHFKSNVLSYTCVSSC